MTMHKILDPRDDIDRLYISRKAVKRLLTSIEDCVDFNTRLDDYIREIKEELIRAASNNISNIRQDRKNHKN